jgi:hypothetical protein
MPQKKAKKAVRRNTPQQGGHPRASTKATLDDFIKNGKPVRGFSNLDSGTYDGYIKAGSALLDQKADGGDRCTMTLVTEVPDKDGNLVEKEQRKRDDLSTQFGYNLLLGDLANMDFPVPTTRAELGQMLSETDNLKIKFWVGKPQDEFPPKVRINELLEDQGSSPASSDEPTVTKAAIDAMSDDTKVALAEEYGIDHAKLDWDELDKELYNLAG